MKAGRKAGLWLIATFALVLMACGDGNIDGGDNSVIESEVIADFDQAQSDQTSTVNTKISKTVRPPAVSNSPTAKFKFSCTAAPCTFKCQLDSSAWERCKSPKTYTGLDEGDHTFKVKATNSSGISDRTPAKYAWKVQFGTWTPTTISGAPVGTANHTVVWTNSEMIVWGGLSSVSPKTQVNTGAKYNPTTNSWATVTTTNAPGAREGHRAVWTGNEMIVWGGYGGGYLNTGGRYVPSLDLWSATSTTNAPSARSSHTQIWTGLEMIVFGGDGASNTGGRYSPASNSWTATNTTGAPGGRTYHAAVWTGTEMIVWGGNSTGTTGFLNTGGRYFPVSNSWSAISTTNAPTPRDLVFMVWTETELLVWGGRGATGKLNTGGRYNPTYDSWTPISKLNAPTATDSNTDNKSVWTGTEWIIWGGYDGYNYLNTGGRYNPTSNTWTPTSQIFVPAARCANSAIWTGTEMIVWGGVAGVVLYNSGGKYTP